MLILYSELSATECKLLHTCSCIYTIKKNLTYLFFKFDHQKATINMSCLCVYSVSSISGSYNKSVLVLFSGVDSLFNKINCDRSAITDMLGGKSGATDANMMQVAYCTFPLHQYSIATKMECNWAL